MENSRPFLTQQRQDLDLTFARELLGDSQSVKDRIQIWLCRLSHGNFLAILDAFRDSSEGLVNYVAAFKSERT